MEGKKTKVEIFNCTGSGDLGNSRHMFVLMPYKHSPSHRRMSSKWFGITAKSV